MEDVSLSLWRAGFVAFGGGLGGATLTESGEMTRLDKGAQLPQPQKGGSLPYLRGRLGPSKGGLPSLLHHAA